MATTTTANSIRDSIRAKVFAHKPLKKVIITIFGAEIELRQPTLGSIMEARDAENANAGVIDTLVQYAYVPGTDEKVFEESDADAFKELPADTWIQTVADALQKLSDVNFTGTENDSEKTTGSSQ